MLVRQAAKVAGRNVRDANLMIDGAPGAEGSGRIES